MNADRIKELAKTIRELTYVSGPEWENYAPTDHLFFNMCNSSFYRSNYDETSEDDDGLNASEIVECGSPACIAGWTIHKFHKKPEQTLLLSAQIQMQQAMNLLDISHEEKSLLFMPDNEFACYFSSDEEDARFISPSRAANVLEHFAETGVIDWSIE